MKLTIERSALLRALQHVQSVVERRNTIPILSNMLLAAEGRRLSLTATDMDMAVVDGAVADVAQPGSITAPAHMLYDIVRKLPEGAQVELTMPGNQDRLLLRAGRSEFTLLCLPTEDFPALDDGNLPHRFELPAAQLRRLIDKTRFAISKEETRYYLNGVYLHVANGDGGARRLCAVATDGHRLARVDLACPKGAEDMPGVIIPNKAVNEIRRLIEDAEDDVAVALSETKIRVASGGAVLTSKLIDGTFPDYQRVIPTHNDKIMMVAGKAFADAVDRVSTIASDKSRAIKLSIDGGRLVLSAHSPDQASATEELPVDYSADKIEIGFNSRYVLEMTAQIEGENMRFEMADAASPTLVGDSADSSAIYVLMPMRV